MTRKFVNLKFKSLFFLKSIVLAPLTLASVFCSFSYSNSQASSQLNSQANSQTHCHQLIDELRQMKRAQYEIQSSLIQNHDMIASSLESYSEALSSSQGRAYKPISNNMINAGQLLKQRGFKGQDLAQKLADKTEDLIKKTEKCLK